MSVEDEVCEAVQGRAAALAAGVPAGLTRVLHPQFWWTSHRGETFDRDAYVRANTGGGLRWLAQVVEQVDVVVVGDTGVARRVVSDQVQVDGEQRSYRMPVTQTWVRALGGWVCLAGHAGPAL